MTIRKGLCVAVALAVAGCGGSSPGDTGSTALARTGGQAGSDPAAHLVGTYSGTMTLPFGNVTYTLPVKLEVSSPASGIVRVPVREMCPSVDHVDFAPPEALLIAVAEPGAWSFSLPTGEHVRLGSIHPRFGNDGRTLTITFHGSVEGSDLEWTFEGAR